MTIRFFTSFLLLFIMNCSFAQTEVIDSVQNQEVSVSGYNKQKALTDIRKGSIKIILPGGIVAAAKLLGDEAFEKKYGINFFSQGCVRFPKDNEAAYNEEVFKYLDQKFGKEWRDEIRKDAIGFNNSKD